MSDPTFATRVELTNKDDRKGIEVDFAIVGAGAAPATGFLKHSDRYPQSVLEKDSRILVDEYLRLPALDDVFVIRDIAVYP